MKTSFNLSSLSIIIVYYITTVQTTIIPYNILTYMYIEGILCHRKSDVRGRKRAATGNCIPRPALLLLHVQRIFRLR